PAGRARGGRGSGRVNDGRQGRDGPQEHQRDDREVRRQRAQAARQRHRIASWLRNRRRLNSSTGMMPIKRTTAVALARPKLRTLKSSLYIRRALTYASKFPPAMT